MDWFAASGPLIAIRGIHFAATAVVAGTLVFRAVVAKPALPAEQAVAEKLQAQSQRVAWIALAIALLSGVIWLLLQAVSMSGLPPDEAMTSQVLSTVLNQTQFGDGDGNSQRVCGFSGRLPGVRPFPAGGLARARGGSRPHRRDRLDGSRRIDARRTRQPASRRRCAASRCRGKLDRRPGAAGAAACCGSAG